MTGSVTTDKDSVLDLIKRLRAELSGADASQIESAVQGTSLRVLLGDLLTVKRITVEDAREALGELAAAVFGVY